MIKFEEFFKVQFPEKTKVKFNMGVGSKSDPAWDYLIKGEDNPTWIELNGWKDDKKRDNGGNNKNQNLNKADYLLAFAQYYPYGPSFYIFGGMYRVNKIIPEVYNAYGYELTLMDDFKEYRRRLIIKLEKPIGGKTLYNVWYSSVQEKFNPEIYELAPSTKLGAFPGYNSVLLTHKELQMIFRMEAPEWKKALSCVKGVYCITDTSTGELYIGSASGDTAGIWQRWSAYADVSNLTGGNKTFEELKNNGSNYIIDNFTYSILEIFDMRTKRDVIILREEFWKRVFKTVEYGMNNVRKIT